MEGAHAHLLFNHFPIIGTIIAILVLAAGIILKNDSVKKTALAIAIFTAVMTIPAFLTGEDAEHALKAIDQAPMEIIHEHEELGEIGIWTTLAIGLLAAFTFMKMKTNLSKMLCIVILLALIGNALFMAQVSNAGGEIRHTEIRKIN